MTNSKFDIQNNQYIFPYHYLANIDNGIPNIKKTINWGYEYLTYIRLIIDEINDLEFSSIIDIGCGDGYLLNNLNLDSNKYGVDLSSEAINFANSFSKDAKFEVKDIFELSNKYGLVTLIEVLEHIPDDLIQSFIAKTLDLVDKDGYFIISVPSTVVKTHTKHYRHYDEDLLVQHLSLGEEFKLVKEFRVYKESYLLKVVVKILNNGIFTINSEFILKLFWKWHIKYNQISSKSNGKHIVQIYKRIN